MVRHDRYGNLLHTGESVRKRDNRYVYRYMDATGKRCSIYAKNIHELRLKERDFLGLMKSTSDVYTKGIISLNEAFDYYMAGKKNLKKNTSDNYYYTYDHYVRECFGKNLVTQYKRSDILFFYRSLYDNHLSVSTLDNIQTLLYPTFQMLFDDGIIRCNPANNALKDFRKNHNLHAGVRNALTQEQERTFLDYVRTEPTCKKWRNLLIILFGTGMRIGECLGLLWENVDFAERTITIDHSLVMLRDAPIGSRCSISTPKTESGNRTIPMIDAVYDAFMDEYERQEREGRSDVVIGGVSGFIFTNKEGNPMNYYNVNSAIERIRRDCNEQSFKNCHNRQVVVIPHFSCHHIRHTFCALLCQNESNIKVIQMIMGHRDIRTTMDIYASVTIDRTKLSLLEYQSKLM